MKAIDAAKQAVAVVKRTQGQRVKKAAENRIARIKNEREKRKRFYTELLDDATESIKYAANLGKRTCDISKWNAAKEVVRAQAELDKHGYNDLIKRVERKLRKDGYKVSREMTSNSCWTEHESFVPDYEIFSYHAVIRIKW